MMPRKAIPPEGVREELQASFAHHRWLKSLNSLEYDGIAGRLPPWAPAPLAHEFGSIRSRLLTSAEALETIHGYIVAIRNHRNQVAVIDAQQRQDAAKGIEPLAVFFRSEYVPAELQRDLEALLYIQDLVSLGPHRGIKAYLGRGTIVVARGVLLSDANRENARKPRPNAISNAIDAALSANPKASSKSIIRALPMTLIKGFRLENLEKRISRARRRLAQSKPI